MGYYFSFGLDLWSRAQFQLTDKHQFSATLSLPVVSFNTRSDYLWHTDTYLEETMTHNDLKILGEFIANGQMESWGTAQLIDFDLQYCYNLSEKWALGGRYLFSVSHHDTPTSFGQVDHGFYIIGQLKF